MLSRLSQISNVTATALLAFASSYASVVRAEEPAAIANRLHIRLAGVPPTAAIRARMTELIQAGNFRGAAEIVVNEVPSFIDVTAKQFVAPMTNEGQVQDVPLNDYIATGAGIIRDNFDFRLMLYGDVYYKAADGLAGVTAWASDSNLHYSSFEASSARKLSNTSQLVPGKTGPAAVPAGKVWALNELLGSQSGLQVGGIAAANWAMQNRPDATSGALTTRAAGQAFFEDGTNRAMWRFTLINYLCRDMENVHDTTQSDFMVRRDVVRAPGGDSRLYKSQCAGCHAIQDSLTPAYAHYDFDANRLVYTPNVVNDKYITRCSPAQAKIRNGTATVVGGYCDLNNDNVRQPNELAPDERVNFELGYMVRNDGWVNQLTGGANAKLGWRNFVDASGVTQIWKSGSGMKSLGKVVSSSLGFSQCMTERVYKKVCVLPMNKSMADQVTSISKEFESGGYKMKFLFARVAEACVKAESEL